EDFDSLDGRIVFLAVGGSLGNPTQQQVVLIGALFQPAAPAVGQLVERFAQQQTELRGRRKNAPPTVLLDQPLEVLFGIEAQQRQAEAVLAARFAMAAAGVAARLGEDRHNLVGEVDWPR